MNAIHATFVKLGTMADGTPRLTLDLQCTLAEVAAFGLMPGVPFALARLTKEASVAATQEPEKLKGGPLAKLAGMWCNEPEFWKFCAGRFDVADAVTNAEEAADLVRFICTIGSRAELDSDPAAAERFEKHFRLPYMAWMEGRNT